MLARKLTKQYSVEEYLKLEDRSHIKHEYHDGELYAMAGGSSKHSRLSVNIITQLGLFLEDHPSCDVYNSDMRVFVDRQVERQSSKSFVYPDASVSCSKKDRESLDRLSHPKVIIEVLSNSTELYDRTTKFEIYKGIKDLVDYVLISQDEKKVEVLHKIQGKSDTWSITTYKEGKLQIPSIKFECDIDRIYNKISLAQI